MLQTFEEEKNDILGQLSQNYQYILNFVGYKDKGEFYFVVSEGVAYSDSDKLSDGKSYGLLPKDRAQILIDLGCDYATQLDGGGSVIVWFMGKQLQSKYQIKTERDWLSDFVYFK